LLVAFGVTVELIPAEQMLDPFALYILASCIAILVMRIAAEDFS
jgi:hypothetical protein